MRIARQQCLECLRAAHAAGGIRDLSERRIVVCRHVWIPIMVASGAFGPQESSQSVDDFRMFRGVLQYHPELVLPCSAAKPVSHSMKEGVPGNVLRQSADAKHQAV